MPVRIGLRSINDTVLRFLCGGSAVIARVCICTANIMAICIFDADLKLSMSVTWVVLETSQNLSKWLKKLLKLKFYFHHPDCKEDMRYTISKNLFSNLNHPNPARTTPSRRGSS